LSAVVGLLAPPPEAADASKRKLGADGVAACDKVLLGEKAESNTNRRLSLWLARATHQIEAKNYEGAIADVAKVRAEAQAAGLMDDPYFRQSRALSFDQLEAAALIRMKRFAEADAKSFASAGDVKYSLGMMAQMSDYAAYVPAHTEQSLGYSDQLTRLYPSNLGYRGNRLLEARRFAEGAQVYEDLITLDITEKTEVKDWNQITWPMASAAVAHALAGNWDKANARAKDARDNMQRRISEGKPDSDTAAITERLDLFEVFKLAHEGKMPQARRMFTGRSAWVNVPYGAVLEANRRLRPGAPADDLINSLAKSADEMWAQRRDERLAELVAKDNDNKSLYALQVPMSPAGGFESLSNKVWKTDKSKILIKRTSTPEAKDQVAFLYNVVPSARYVGFLLHSALMAKKDGKNAILFMPFRSQSGAASIRFGNKGDANMPGSLVLDPDPIIAALSPIIPDPATLKARRAAAKKK
jgi:hypothetical protein